MSFASLRAESQRLVESIKDRVAAARLKREAEARAAELRRSAAVRLRKQIQETEPVSQTVAGTTPASQAVAGAAEPHSSLLSEVAEINERDTVVIKSLGKNGVVESISGETYTVLVGSLRFRARREELEIVRSAPPHASKRAAALPRGVSGDFKADEDFASEINIIGTTVNEAQDRVDKFLDNAFMAGAETVRIVHGHGKGALRRAISELLSGHPHVERFSLAPAKEGGAGATVAVLKK